MQRAGCIQEGLSLHCKGEASGNAADLIVQQADISVRQVFSSLITLAYDEVDDLIERSLSDHVGFLGCQHSQRHRDVAVSAGQFEEIIRTQNLCLVRIVLEVLQPTLVLGFVLVHRQVHGLD